MVHHDLDADPLHKNMDGIAESERDNLLKHRFATSAAMTVGMIMVGSRHARQKERRDKTIIIKPNRNVNNRYGFVYHGGVVNGGE